MQNTGQFIPLKDSISSSSFLRFIFHGSMLKSSKTYSILDLTYISMLGWYFGIKTRLNKAPLTSKKLKTTKFQIAFSFFLPFSLLSRLAFNALEMNLKWLENFVYERVFAYISSGKRMENKRMGERARKTNGQELLIPNQNLIFASS